MRRPRYSAWFAAVLGVLFVVAIHLISDGRSARRSTPVLSSAEAEAGAANRLVPDIGDPALIRPSEDDYREFAQADAEWRRRFAPRVTARRFEVASGETWRPAPRDAVRDSVFILTQRAQLAEAIVVLERWVAANPRDAELMLELARLLNQVGRTEESLARYRQVLALGDPRKDVP